MTLQTPLMLKHTKSKVPEEDISEFKQILDFPRSAYCLEGLQEWNCTTCSETLQATEIKLAGDFTQLNVWQQDALAKAAQMTVEEITKQQNQEKMLAALKNSTNEKDRKTAADYDKMMKSISENENNAKNNLVARGREMANQQLRQTQLNQLTNSFSAIWTEITDQLVAIAEYLMPIVQILSWAMLGFQRLVGMTVRLILSPLTFNMPPPYFLKK